MFCYQCEQTFRSDEGVGCAGAKGMCGKDAVTADLQDILLHVSEGIGQYSHRARTLGKTDAEAGRFVLYAFFTTLTNVNVNAGRFVELIQQAAQIRDRVKALYESAARAAGKEPETLSGPAAFVPAKDMNGLLTQAGEAAVRKDAAIVGEDVVGLRSLLLYGLKGAAAYAYHAGVLGEGAPPVTRSPTCSTCWPASRPRSGPCSRRPWRSGVATSPPWRRSMRRTRRRFGTPSPTAVRITPRAGKAILVSGHDLPISRRSSRPPGHRHQRLHAWRTVAGARLPEAQGLSAPRRQLRRRLAGPADANSPPFPARS